VAIYLYSIIYSLLIKHKAHTRIWHITRHFVRRGVFFLSFLLTGVNNSAIVILTYTKKEKVKTMKQDNQTRLANRHIAKLLDRLSIFNLPELVQSEIKRQMHFLKEDIVTSVNKEKSENKSNEETNFNR